MSDFPMPPTPIPGLPPDLPNPNQPGGPGPDLDPVPDELPIDLPEYTPGDEPQPMVASADGATAPVVTAAVLPASSATH